MAIMTNKSVVVLVMTFWGWWFQLLEVVWSFNPHQPQQRQHLQPNSELSSTPATAVATRNSMECSRRQWLSNTVFGTLPTLLTTTLLLNPQTTHAACLQGDSRRECIGVYKVPIDERILPYISTPEALSKYAPDIQWVPPVPIPTTISMALEEWANQRTIIVQELIPLIQQGRLEEAGINLLKVLPVLTVTSTMILDDAIAQVSKQQISSVGRIGNSGEGSNGSPLTTLVTEKLESQCALALGLWGETDIMIGQALKGDLGVSAVAQIMLLKQFQEALIALDDFGALAFTVTGRQRPRWKKKKQPPISTTVAILQKHLNLTSSQEWRTGCFRSDEVCLMLGFKGADFFTPLLVVQKLVSRE